MRNAPAIDAARLGTLLNELRLPAIKVLWPHFAERADKKSWPAARFLSAIAEHELAERDRPGGVGAPSHGIKCAKCGCV